jgi:hypothetical protein
MYYSNLIFDESHENTSKVLKFEGVASPYMRDLVLSYLFPRNRCACKITPQARSWTSEAGIKLLLVALPLMVPTSP